MDVHSAELGCWLCDCTAGRLAISPDEEVRAVLAEQQRRLALPPVVAHAEMVLRGEYAVTVEHGAPEPSEEAALLLDELYRLAAADGCLRSRGGGSEHSTFVFGGPGAEAAARRFLQAAQSIGPHWWKVTPTLHPRWR
jgi:hypothetical protein